jgi:hypothetical protein
MRAIIFAGVLLAGCMGSIPDPGPGPVNTAPDAGMAQPTPDAAPPPPNAEQLLANWSGCMTLANFQAANMAQAWGTMTTDGNKECSNCHGTGEFGVIASTDENLFFSLISQHSAYLATYFTVQGTDVVIDTGSFQNAGVTDASHPRFDPTTNKGMTALQQFYDATKAAQAAGTCGSPTLVD